MTVPSVDLMRL